MLSLDPIQTLRKEFRRQLETFYAHLKLAPPYHSIEKAVQHLANTLRTKSQPFQQSLLDDPQKQWALFEEIFQASGLSRKHRGIIIQLAHTPSFSLASEESLRFLKIFTKTSSSRQC